MKITVGTSAVEIDEDDLGAAYPDREERGQVLVIQNLGPGNLFLDYSSTPLDGIKVSTDVAYEFPSGVTTVRGLSLVATEASDVRIVVMG